MLSGQSTPVRIGALARANKETVFGRAHSRTHNTHSSCGAWVLS
jgi:hypothetical protein